MNERMIMEMIKECEYMVNILNNRLTYLRSLLKNNVKYNTINAHKQSITQEIEAKRAEILQQIESVKNSIPSISHNSNIPNMGNFNMLQEKNKWQK